MGLAAGSISHDIEMGQPIGMYNTGILVGSFKNLLQNHMNDLAEVRELVRTGDYETLGLKTGNT